MFSSSKPKEPKIETVVGAGTEFEGDIRTTECIRIDGKIKGGVQAESVVLGPTGVIVGDISANKITISGKIKGNVAAATLLEILVSGQIAGDIRTSKLVIADGAKFEGNCQMVKSDGQIIEMNPESLATREVIHTPKNIKIVAENGRR